MKLKNWLSWPELRYSIKEIQEPCLIVLVESQEPCLIVLVGSEDLSTLLLGKGAKEMDKVGRSLLELFTLIY